VTLPQPDTSPDAPAIDFLARLGAAMMAANYPITIIRRTLALSSQQYGLSNQVLLLPNFVQFGGFDGGAGTKVRVVRSEDDLRYDQEFPLATLVADAQNGRIAAQDGLVELNRIHALPPRFPAWVNVVGYTVQSAAFGLILQPTAMAMVAATGFGLMVGLMGLLGRISNALGQLLPTICSFLVAFMAFGLERLWHFGDDSLRDLRRRSPCFYRAFQSPWRSST
jgi:uncharacterized membrane protein YjjP (DUF1212 family)